MSISDTLYSPLNSVKKEIRVIEVVAIKPKIVCRLSHVALLDNPTFDALSYTWGDASRTEHIIVDGQPVQVTVNLAHAIRAVYYQWDKLHETSGPHRLWADAVCINQADMKEKEHQIPLMRTIYTDSATVFVWLGTPPHRLEESFNALDKLATAESTCAELSQADQKLLLKEWPSTIKLPELRDSIHILLKDEYWTRVWTFQEITLGRNVALIGGTEAMAFQSLVLAEAYIRRYMESVDGYTSDPRKNAELWYATRKIFQLLSVVFDIGEVKESVEATMIRMDGEAEKLNFEDLSLLGFQLSRCCALATERRATHPKDFVYGFSAILDMQLIPDYSPETTVASIYCDLMQQALSSGGNMCLQLLDSAGIGHSWELMPGLPSWGPNFASVSKAASQGLQQPLIKSNWASFVGLHDDRPPNIVRATNSLFCTAITLDTIADPGPCLDHGLPNAPWIQWLYDVLIRIHSHDTISPIHLRPIVDAITKSTTSTSLFHPPTTAFGVATTSYDNHLILLLVMILERLWDAHPPNTSTKIEFLQALLPGTIDAWGKSSMLSAYTVLKATDRDYVEKLLLREWSELCSTVQGLRIAQTAAGHFGLFPPRIRAGDVVAMVNTCTNPAVLRRTGECWAFVGWCHVLEYNDRAVDGMVRDGLGKLERIEIR